MEVWIHGRIRCLSIEHKFTSENGTTTRPVSLHSFFGTVYTEYKNDKWLFNARMLGGQNLSHLIVLGGYGLVIFAGYLKNFGTDKQCTIVYGIGSNVADVIKTATSLEFNYKGLNVAVECEYSNAAYANWLGKRLVEDYRVGNVKGILRVSYNFNHVWNL